MNELQKIEQPSPQELDRVVHTQLARFTQGVSPATLGSASLDWLTHLALSPGKQHELLEKAFLKSVCITEYALRGLAEQCQPCIDPLPQDRRFVAPEWQQWPFNLMYQSFLLNQQWWHNATSSVPGVTAHHEQLVTFAVRQVLDIFSPSNSLLTNPEVLAETLKTGGMNLVQGAQNMYQEMLRKLSEKPQPGTEKFRPGKEVALTPGKVVFRNHLIELIQYSAQTDTVFAEPILIVPSWIMKYYILDLSPENSLINYLVEKGHTVFIISWKNPGSRDRNLGMDDYLKAGVMAAIDAVSAIVPKQKIQALGYCLGGTLQGIAAAYMAREDDERLNTLTLLASELDFEEPGELGMFIDESQLSFLNDAMARKGYLDGKHMAGAFTLLNSRDLVWSRMVHDYLMGRQHPVTDLSAWNVDATRMPYRQHREYLTSLYLHNDLAHGNYHVDGKPIALSDIRVPIFALGTQRDTVSPWHSVYKIQLLTPAEVTFCLSSGGHNVGVVNPPGPGVKRSYQIATRKAGGRFMDPKTWQASHAEHEGSWWPALALWLQHHASSERVKPPRLGNKARGYPVLEDAPGRYVLVP
ncbi:MAG: alpha/beta fold hydrolase [Polaromonas sp.]